MNVKDYTKRTLITQMSYQQESHSINNSSLTKHQKPYRIVTCLHSVCEYINKVDPLLNRHHIASKYIPKLHKRKTERLLQLK